MKAISELIVRVFDLAEAEGRVLRSVTVRVALGLAMLLTAAGAVAAGLALILAGVYLWLNAELGSAGAAAITGTIAVCVGGLIGWVGARIAK